MAGVLILPLAVSSPLGFLWLYERGLLLYFALGCVVLAGSVWGGKFAMRLRRRKAASNDQAAREEGAPDRSLASPPIDPNWTERETAAYEAARKAVEARLEQPLKWEELPPAALAVIEDVAAHLSDGKRGALDFTVPEALLLIDRVALRYREFLRANVPFSDQLSVRAIRWLWGRKETARTAWKFGYAAYRGVRVVLNPPVALLRELERAATSGLQDRLTDQLMRDAQVILLEEVAQAAIDLYSGRLKFSDAELIEIQLGSELRDRQRLAQPDDPVRILVVGQISAGKSTLINAILGDDPAETDLAPTTDRVTAHEAEIDGIPCRFVDTMGLDGTQAVTTAIAGEMAQADMVIWAVRASRPARAPDDVLRGAFEAHFASGPARRRPPVIVVATAADTLLSDWPYSENRLPEKAQKRIGDAMNAIGQDLGGATPIPVCLEQPRWNIDTLEAAIASAMTEALMTQRNRRRLSAPSGLRFGENLQRASRGVVKGTHVLGRRFLRRHFARRDN